MFFNSKQVKTMKKNESLDHISTLLGVGTAIEGTLTFNDTIRLDGSVNGKILSEKGTVIIGERAIVGVNAVQMSRVESLIRAEIEHSIVITGRSTDRPIGSEYPCCRAVADVQGMDVTLEGRYETLALSDDCLDAGRDHLGMEVAIPFPLKR